MSRARPLAELPEPGPRGVPRYSIRPLPEYRYVPGLHPHPTRDAQGHSYLAVPRPVAAWTPEQWEALEDWRFGVDLFNAFYFWEAHEAWEGLWAVVPRESLPAVFLQGLIQAAAALLKTHLHAVGGARNLANEAVRKLEHVASRRSSLMGVDVPDFASALRVYFTPLQDGLLPPLTVAVPVLRLSRNRRSPPK